MCIHCAYITEKSSDYVINPDAMRRIDGMATAIGVDPSSLRFIIRIRRIRLGMMVKCILISRF